MSKLREVAQALLDNYDPDAERWMTPYWDALREALQEDVLDEMQALTASEYQELSSLAKKRRNLDAALEYEFIGTLDGAFAGRWTLTMLEENWSAVWPKGTAVYVRRVNK
jgi:hypothetical protein